MQNTYISPEYMMTKANQKLNIYEGYCLVEIDGKEYETECSVFIDWLPMPYVKIKLEVKESFISDQNEIYISLNSNKQKIILIRFDVNEKTLIGIYNQSLTLLNQDTRVKKIKFTLVNGFSNFGDYIKINNFSYAGRFQFIYKNFIITIDKVENYSDVFQSLKEVGGSAITHSCLIEDKSGELFKLEDVEHLVQSVEWLFTLISGNEVLTLSIHGFNRDGNLCLEKIMPPAIKKIKNSYYTWYENLLNYESLGQLFLNLIKKKENKLWNKALRVTLSLYVDTKTTMLLENKIVAIQEALEILAWTYMVEDKKIISRSKFNELNAKKRLKEFMGKLNISVEIKTPKLEKKYDNQIDLIVDYRNSISHPKKIHLDTHFEDVNNLYEVFKVSEKLLNNALLSILGYKSESVNINPV